ncbi:unnamed protein product [Boreogadus saida]
MLHSCDTNRDVLGALERALSCIPDEEYGAERWLLLGLSSGAGGTPRQGEMEPIGRYMRSGHVLRIETKAGATDPEDQTRTWRQRLGHRPRGPDQDLETKAGPQTQRTRPGPGDRGWATDPEDQTRTWRQRLGHRPRGPDQDLETEAGPQTQRTRPGPGDRGWATDPEDQTRTWRQRLGHRPRGPDQDLETEAGPQTQRTRPGPGDSGWATDPEDQTRTWRQRLGHRPRPGPGDRGWATDPEDQTRTWRQRLGHRPRGPGEGLGIETKVGAADPHRYLSAAVEPNVGLSAENGTVTTSERARTSGTDVRTQSQLQHAQNEVLMEPNPWRPIRLFSVSSSPPAGAATNPEGQEPCPTSMSRRWGK